LKALGFSEGKNLNIVYGRVDDPRGAFVALTSPDERPTLLVAFRALSWTVFD